MTTVGISSNNSLPSMQLNSSDNFVSEQTRQRGSFYKVDASAINSKKSSLAAKFAITILAIGSIALTALSGIAFGGLIGLMAFSAISMSKCLIAGGIIGTISGLGNCLQGLGVINQRRYDYS